MRMNRYTYLLLLFSCLLPSAFLKGQGICSNSALAPVYSQTFGTSPASTTKTTVPFGFITNYHFDKVGTDGNYIVTPLVQNSAKGDWTLGGDHTGNVNGNLFLVNAGTGASLFFYQQVDNLCPGSVFNFSAWLGNVNTPNTLTICGNGYVYPKVIFNIKNTAGVKLASDTTGNLPLSPNTGPVNWQQHNFQFALPSGTTSLILEMVDYYGGKPQCGNDLVLDDIVFSACTPLVTASLTTDSTICYGTSTSITSTLTNSPFSHPAYQWQKSVDGGTTWNNIGGAGNMATSFSIASAVVSDGGLYRVIVGPDIASLTSSTCVSVSTTVELSVNPALQLTVGGNNQICTGNSLNLTSTASGGTGPYVYAWTGPNGFTSTIANPIITNISTAASGTYSLAMKDSMHCTANSSLAVTVGTTPDAVAPILGNSGGCLGTKFSISDSSVDGIWSSSDTTIASINASGVVTLLNNGTVSIAYTVTNGFCAASATKLISASNVILHPDIVDCTNGITPFNASDPYYGVFYSNANPSNSYTWTISGGPFSFLNASSPGSPYPDLQLMSGAAYQVMIQFTSNGITCSDTQMVYKNIITADSIQGSHDTTICFNANAISLSGKASSTTNTHAWTTSGTGIFSNTNALVTTYTPSMADKASGLIKLYLKGTGNCVSVAAMDSITLNILPDNVGVSSSQVFCSNQSLHYIPSATIAGSSFSWTSTILAGSITGNTANGTGNILDSLVNLSNSDAIVLYTITPFAFTPANKTCVGTPFTYTITSKPNPVITITNNPASICSGSKTNIQFTSSISGTSFNWSSSVISGNLTGNSTQAIPSGTNTITDHLVIVSSTNATVRYHLMATSPAGCSKTDSTDVLVYGNPTLANAGADQYLCNVGLALLEGNNPILGTGNWLQISGPSAASFGTQQAATCTIQGLIAGTYLFTWTITNGSCTASSDTVAIYIAPQTFGGDLTGDATICSGTNTGTITLTGYTGKITGWEISLDGGSHWTTINHDTSNQYTYHNLSATTLFRASVKSGSCNSVLSNATTIIVNTVSAPGILSADAVVCISGNDGTIILQGYSGKITRWEYSIDSGDTWISIGKTTDTLTYKNLTTTTKYRVIVQSGTCYAIFSNIVTIHVYLLTAGGLLTPSHDTACAIVNTGSIFLQGFKGTILNWELSTDFGNSWTILPYTDSTYKYTSLKKSSWYRVLIQEGVCSSAYSKIAVIKVDPTTVPGVLKGTNLVCKGNNNGQLFLVEKKGDILRWEFSTDHGTSWNPISETKDTLSYTNLLTSTIYRVLVKNGACTIEYSNTILITIVAPPSIAFAGADQIICDEKATCKLEGNTPTSGAGIWTMASGPSKISFSDASLPGSTVTGLQTGTYQFVWTISNTMCANSIDTVQIKVDKVTAGFSLTNYIDCGKATFQFTNTSKSGFGINNYQWFTNKGDTMSTKEITQVYTTEGIRSMSLQVLSKSGCVSLTKATYDVTIFQYPKANIDAIASACKNQLLQVSSNVSSKDSIIYLLWNLNNTTRMKDSIITVQYMTDGIYAVKLTVATINRCFDSAYKQINVHPLPFITIKNLATICKGDTAVLTASGALNYIWTDQTEKIVCNGCTTAIVRPSSNSEYKVIGYNEYGCSEIQTTKIRVIQPLKILATQGDTICVGQSTHLFARGAATYSWYPKIGLNNIFIAAPIAKPLKTISYHVIGKDDVNCFSDTAEVTIVVGDPTPIYLGSDTVIAAGSFYQLIARPSVQNIRKWHWSGSVDFTSRTIASPQIKIVNDATITCLAVNAFACPSTDTLHIKTFCAGTDIFIPNAFTPDGDGINDLLIVQGKGVKMIKRLLIFNRWGEIVFEKMNFLPGDRAYGWDGRIRGKAAPPDIFVYVCEVICEKGLSSIFKGNVAILK